MVRTTNRSPRLFALATAVLGGATAPGDVATDGTLGPATALAGPAFEIPATLGTQRGGNLFHSFSRLNLAADETATFSGPASVTHVLARVTGGSASQIDGTLRCTIPGADLYFINPAGVVFGPTANLDVSGSFVVTTADVLRHADGARFDAARPEMSVLTSAPPAAFGFLALPPAPITLRGGGTDKLRPSDVIVPLAGSLTVREGKSVQLVGGRITLDGGLAAAPGGRVDLVAVASPAEVGLVAADVTAPLTVSSGATLADVELSNAGLDTGGLGPGVVTVRGHHARMDKSFIGARVFAERDGRGIHLEFTGDLDVIDTDIASDADGQGTGRGGDVSVRAANILVLANDRVSDIATDSFGPGDAGNLRVDVPGTLSVISRGGVATVSTSAVRGGGDGGSVTVNAGRVFVSAKGVTVNPLPLGVLPILGPDGDFELQEIAAAAVISATALEAGGDAGRVEVNAREIRVEEGGIISSASLGPGAAGGLKLTADRIVVTRGASPFLTGIQTVSIFPTGGNSGDLEINAKRLTVRDGALVSASTFGAGDGGSLRVDVGRLRVERAGGGLTGLLAATQGTGAGGDIRVDAGRVVLDGGTVQSASGGPGRAGTLEIVAGAAVLRRGAAVTTAAFVADGGSMMLQAGRIDVSGGSEVSAQAAGDGGNIRLVTPAGLGLSGSRVTARAGGDGGNIELDADAVGLNSSQLVAAAVEGDGGDIRVAAGGFLATPGSVIDASSQFGMSGNVSVTMPDPDVASSLAVLPASLAAADARLAERCALRTGATTSSFVRTGRGGAPLLPGGWQPSIEPRRRRP